jgi:metacaspase-1
MTRKTDLADNIRKSYDLIHQYEEILRLSSDPKEKVRTQLVIDEQRKLIVDHVIEYKRLYQRSREAIPRDIAEIIGEESGRVIPAAQKDLIRHAKALIIGVGGYNNPPFTNLPATVRDAEALAKVITDPYRCGYSENNVVLLTEDRAIASNIRNELRQLAIACVPDATALIFFSGHGIRISEKGDWQIYLCPKDCDVDNFPETAILGEELSNLLSAISAQKMLVILDACHAGGAAELKSLSGFLQIKAGVSDSYLEKLSEGRGRVVIASSKQDQVSRVRPQGDLSLFTYHLIQALIGGAAMRDDGFIHVLDVFHYVNEKVTFDQPNQVPILKVKDLDMNFPVALARNT